VKRARIFESWLASHFKRFVDLKRAGGASYTSSETLLLAFDRFLCARASEPPLQRDVVTAYLTSLAPLSTRSRENMMVVVWPALAYAERHGARIDSLPPRPASPSNSLRQRRPRIVSAAEIGRILSAARQLRPSGSLRSATTATLVGLLFTTGLRIGEALALEVGDLDAHDELLAIRRGKFGKARTLPLRSSTVAALVQYIQHPLRRVNISASAPIFVSGWHRRLSPSTATHALRSACRLAGIAAPHPTRHDLRHSFAVGRVLAWYDDGRDVDTLLPALSTYLGHVSVENTRVYLSANGLLLDRAAARFDRKSVALDEVRL
jgi:integrase